MTVTGAISGDDGPALCSQMTRLLEGAGRRSLICDVGAVAGADVAVVDVLARLQLTARRRGTGIRLRGTSAELRRVIGLCGLDDVLPAEDT